MLAVPLRFPRVAMPCGAPVAVERYGPTSLSRHPVSPTLSLSGRRISHSLANLVETELLEKPTAQQLKPAWNTAQRTNASGHGQVGSQGEAAARPHSRLHPSQGARSEAGAADGAAARMWRAHHHAVLGRRPPVHGWMAGRKCAREETDPLCCKITVVFISVLCLGFSGHRTNANTNVREHVCSRTYDVRAWPWQTNKNERSRTKQALNGCVHKKKRS